MDTSQKVAALEPANRNSFNGAMTSQPWIHARLHGRRTHRVAFNGAMTSQPWILSPLLAGENSAPAFNGAMTSQPWIRLIRRWTTLSALTLQWSHDLSAMDTSHIVIVRFNGAMTSQPWIRMNVLSA